MSIVIDCGSGLTKAGFSGDDAPRSVFPTVIGCEVLCSSENDSPQPVYSIGDEACAQPFLQLRKPLDRGYVEDWDDITRIWRHCFDTELRITCRESNVFLADYPMTVEREKMCQIIFETFQFNGFQVRSQPLLSLFSSGRTTGVVLDCGDKISCSTPICEGIVLVNDAQSMEVGGRDITEHIVKLFGQTNGIFVENIDLIINDVKEKLGYVTLGDYQSVLQEAFSSADYYQKYTLPDESDILVGKNLQMSPEMLFTPLEDFQDKYCGVHELVHKSVLNCDEDIRKNLLNNIVLSGGSTMFRNFELRLKKELTQINQDSDFKIKIIAPIERTYSVFIGGSIVTSMQSFEAQWVTKDEYSEFGVAIVRRKCI